MKEAKQRIGEIFQKKKKMWIIISAVILIVVIGIVFFIKAKSKASEKTVTVQAIEASTGNVTNSIESTGSVSNGSSSNVEIPVGIKVKKLMVSSGDSVTKGQKLAKVTKASVASVLLNVRENINLVEDDIDNLSSDADDSSTEEYLKKIVLENTLSELKSQKKILKKMLSSGYIVATEDGVIDGVNITEGSEVAVTSSSDSSTTSSDTSSSGSASGTSNNSGVSNMSGAANYTVGFIDTKTGNSTVTQTSEGSENVNEQSVEPTDITKSDISGISVTKPVTGAKPQSSISTGSKTCTGTISWDCSGTYQAGTRYTATITLTAAAGYTFQDGSNYGITIAGATLSSDSPKVYETAGKEGNQLIVKATFEKTEENANSNSTGSSTANNQTEAGNSKTGTGTSTGNSGITSGVSGGSSSLSGSSASSSSSGSATVDNTYSVENGVPFSIASGSDVVISVSVDEADINSVSNGQTATVTLDAIEGQQFTGTVTSIAGTATTSNGSSTYPVEITLSKEEGMKVGMSASTTISIEEVTDVVTIPVIALQESHGSSFVYTKKDSEGNLSGEVEVETGLSDGSTVEIKSGLSEGDTIYYQKTESDSSSSEFDMSKMKQGGMQGDRSQMKQNMNGGGTPPSGGAPSGN